MIARAKVELGSSAFAAQYQQEPQPECGGMVRPWWLLRYDAPPVRFSRVVLSFDTAIKSGAQHDASACLVFGEKEGRSYLLDARCERLEYPDLKRWFLAMAARWMPQVVLLEDKASGQQLLQDIRREHALPVVAVRPQQDKVTRFAAVSALIEAGRLALPRQAAWLADFEAELFSFPAGAHDDQVDALTQYLDWVRDSAWRKIQVRGFN
jgi:predicted phage terminase large subunit-like protein